MATTTYYIKLYATCLVAFLIIDGAWLGLMWPTFYRSRIGSVMAADPVWVAAAVFYLLFVAGLLVFVVVPSLPAGPLRPALARAALFGLVAYGTYDLTNLATVEDWPLSVTAVDMVWGATLSVLVASVGVMVGRRGDGT